MPPAHLQRDGESLVAAAQARRDYLRLTAAYAQIDALQNRIATIQHSWGYATEVKLKRCLLFARRLTAVTRRALNHDVATPVISTVAQVASRGRALIIDHHWPTPDRDSGSIDIVTMVHSLISLGFEVTLAAAKQHQGEHQSRNALMTQGIDCLQPDAIGSVAEFLVEKGASLDLVVLCRVYCGGEFLELVQENCRSARIIFNSIDLCFMRVERQAKLLDDEMLLAAAAEIRQREGHIISSCDATIVVSQSERNLLAHTNPESLVATLPLARATHTPITAFAERRNIGFIGGFAHAPNVDAVRFFLSDIWPLIHARIPDCSFDIVGADAPADLLDGVRGPVHLLGHVPDVKPWFESLRVTVAPLRYGAGAKGKVASSLAAGVPCVLTSIAAEGMSLGNADGVIVAINPAEFAEAAIRAYEDKMVWNALSAGGLAYANRTLSLSGWQDQLDRLLLRIGL